MLAEATARELGRIDLREALELTALIARDDPARAQRAAARWLRRYLDERPHATLADAALAVGCLGALGGDNADAALASLRALID